MYMNIIGAEKSALFQNIHIHLKNVGVLHKYETKILKNKKKVAKNV